MIYTAHALKRARGSHYFELFKKLNVTAVVRLNEEKYNAQVSAHACTRARAYGVCVGGCQRVSECMRARVCVCLYGSVCARVRVFVCVCERARGFILA